MKLVVNIKELNPPLVAYEHLHVLGHGDTVLKPHPDKTPCVKYTDYIGSNDQTKGEPTLATAWALHDSGVLQEPGGQRTGARGGGRARGRETTPKKSPPFKKRLVRCVPVIPNQTPSASL